MFADEAARGVPGGWKYSTVLQYAAFSLTDQAVLYPVQLENGSLDSLCLYGVTPRVNGSFGSAAWQERTGAGAAAQQRANGNIVIPAASDTDGPVDGARLSSNCT